MYGKFLQDTAGYEINTLNLPTSWEYIYENKDVLLKVDQFGPVYAQANPPGDIMLFQRERHQKYSPWCVWLELETGERITNFFRPNKLEACTEPQNVKIIYRPECATYTYEYKGLQISTEFFIPNEGVTVVCKLRITNQTDVGTNIKLSAQFIPYLNEAVMAPWDKYEWYLDTKCERKNRICFESKLMDANACAEKRRKACFVTNMDNLIAYETSLEKYIGQGDVVFPQQTYSDQDRLYAYPPVYAALYEWQLSAGEEKELTQIFSLASMDDMEAWFEPEYYAEQKEIRKRRFSILIGVNDVWHELDYNNGVDADKFEKIYSMLIEEIKEALPEVKIMILEPFCLEGSGTMNTEELPGKWNYFRTEVQKRAEKAKIVADKFNLPFILLQDKFDALAEKAENSYWLADGVHPTAMGHEVLKREWLKAFEKIQ